MEVNLDDMVNVEISLLSSVGDVTDVNIDAVWRPDETVSAGSDDAVPLLDAVDDEDVVKIAVPSTYDWTVEGPTDDEAVPEDVMDVAGVKVDPDT